MKYINYLLIIILLIAAGCTMKKDDDKKSNNMKNILMVIAPRDFNDEEFNITKKIFEENGYKITVGSIQKGEATGASGTKVKTDLVVGEANVNHYDAIVFIGGPGMRQILDDESLQTTARIFERSGKLVSAICVAPAILAKADILRDKNATGFSGVKSDIENAGGKYKDKNVVADGNIITASGPEASEDFAKSIIKYLNK